VAYAIASTSLISAQGSVQVAIVSSSAEATSIGVTTTLGVTPQIEPNIAHANSPFSYASVSNSPSLSIDINTATSQTYGVNTIANSFVSVPEFTAIADSQPATVNNDNAAYVVVAQAIASSYSVTVTLGATASTSVSSANATSYGVTATNGQIQILHDIATMLVQSYTMRADISGIVGKLYHNKADIKTILDELSGVPYQTLADIKTNLSVSFEGGYTITADITTEIINPVDGNYITLADIGTPLGRDYVEQGDIKTQLVT